MIVYDSELWERLRCFGLEQLYLVNRVVLDQGDYGRNILNFCKYEYKKYPRF